MDNKQITATDSIFTKIIKRELPANIRYEDDNFIAIDDINPQAPIHILLITKQPIITLEDVDINNEQLHADILTKARHVAKLAGINNNYKLVMNIGRNIQEVLHIHLHIMGGW